MRAPIVDDGFPPCTVVSDDWTAVGDGVGPYDLMTGAGVLGARVWVEREMHRIVGSWVHTEVDPGLAVAFDRVSMHHAERADVLFARLPQLRELPAATVVVPGGPATLNLLDALTGPEKGTGSDSRSRVAAWRAVADGLLAAHRDHLRRTSAVSDGPLRRRLPLLVAGLEADVAELSGSAAGSGVDGPELVADPGVVELVQLTAGFLE